jgi:hypothetical protein
MLCNFARALYEYRDMSDNLHFLKDWEDTYPPRRNKRGNAVDRMTEPWMKTQLVRIEDVYFRRYVGLYVYLTPVTRCSTRLTHI